MSTSRPILAQHNRGHSSARQAGHPYRNGSPATSVSAASSHSRVSSASSVAEMMVASNSRASPNLSNASESAVALWVDQVAARLGLNHDDTSLVHDFAIVSLDKKLITIFVHIIQQRNKELAAAGPLGNITSSLSRIEALCRKSWEPSEGQIKLLKQLLRHYTIKPVATYKDLAGFVRDYIIQHKEKLKLQVYVKDALAKRTVNSFLTKEANECKSQFRKAIFESVRNKVPLAEFAKQMVTAWHMPLQPNPIPDAILATLAMHRSVAGPLAIKRSVKGGDTGHWQQVEVYLADAYDENGNQRGTSSGWLSRT
ncbi:hypothetical protein FIBSPDRAFT_99699 [Athelia psychrophila]|uniref:Uncharacterized protein n=1 Tax=Athelia psychrophila TaxID=1759441 RepID=A0A166DMN6_9AGAM|nr:hypothetical protein FIBSPDRAFT_99699 [Fibularhizoctonia sp. CBS 109695]